MSDVINLGAARAAKQTDAARVSARDLLLDVITQIDSGELKPTHIFVVSAMADETLETQVQLNHAGPFCRFGQIGMLQTAVAMIAGPMA